MMPPRAPLNRPDASAFHYHTYEYPGDAAAGPFQLSGGLPSAGGKQFYSLVEDLNGLEAWGNAVNHVPNLSVTAMSSVLGGAWTSDARQTLMLSLGPAPGVNDAPAVFFTGGIHAREWIAVEVAYLLAEYLVKHYTTAPTNRFQRMIQQIVDHRRICIIPMVNPDGNNHTVFTPAQAGRQWRKNRRWLPGTPAAWVSLLTGNGALGNNPPPFTNVRVPAAPPGSPAHYEVPVFEVPLGIPLANAARYDCPLAPDQIGVDLNRNLRTRAWGYDGLAYPEATPPQPSFTGDPLSDGYLGPAAGSEAETSNVEIAMANAAAATAPGIGITASIDYHSRGQFVLYPSEMYAYGAVDPDYLAFGKMLQALVHAQDMPDYKLGTPRALLDADATGTVMDHAAQRHQSRAFTIELDPARDAIDAWMLPEERICTVFEKNIRGALAALAAAMLPNMTTGHLRYVQFVQLFSTWNVYGRGNQLPA
jgi:Zinc carboxypeptidase